MIEIYKKLPKTNCGRCGAATCMAFALKVKKGHADISDCPFMTGDDQKAIINDSGIGSFSTYEQVGDEIEKEAAGVDFMTAARAVGGLYETRDGGETLRLEMLNKSYELRRDGLFEDNEHCRDPWTKIIICDYVRRMGSSPLTGEWVTLGHFPHTATHVKAFQAAAEKKIAERFRNDLAGLKRCSDELGGAEIKGRVKTDLAMAFNLLPHVQLYLYFWLSDEEFDADCKLFFDSSAEAHIDIEYLACLLERFTDVLVSI